MTQKISNTLIVGGSGSLGRAIANKLASENHNLILTYFNQKEVVNLKKFINRLKNNSKKNITISKLDICSIAQINNFIKNCSLPINNLIYSVSTPLSFKTITKETRKDYEGHYQAQVRGLWCLIKLLTTKDFPLKRIVAIGSTCLFGAPPARLSSYTTAKYGLWGLIKSVAIELGPKNITVNIVSPGPTGEGTSKIYPRLLLDLIKKQAPLKRLVSVNDVAHLVNYLLSEKANYLTGLNIPVAGGFRM